MGENIIFLHQQDEHKFLEPYHKAKRNLTNMPNIPLQYFD